MIKIISSNIRFDNPADEKNAWNFRKNLLSTTFMDIDANIICTQEGRINQLKDLEFLLKGYRLQDAHRSWIAERMYPCLYTHDIECISTGDFWLSTSPYVAGSISFNSAFPRLCSWGEFKVDDQSFLIFNLHLDHTTDDVRFAQINVAISEIKKINSKKLPIVLVGDYNTGPSGVIHELLLKELGLRDPWIDLKKKEESSYHMFKGHFENGKRIDWILLSDRFKCEEIKLLKNHKNEIYISDHFPVYARIELT